MIDTVKVMQLVRVLIILLLIGLRGTVLGAEPEAFSERVRVAKEIEAQDVAQRYFQDEMFPAIGSALADVMRNCLSRSNASTANFAVVADVSQHGEFTRVAFEPKTNTAECFASALRSFRVPSPPTCDSGPLPIVIDMKVIP